MGKGQMQYVFLNQLNKGKQDKRVLVRVVRLWNTYNAQRPEEMMTIDFLILDEKDNMKHCTIRSKFIPEYLDSIEEGNFYLMKNFTVQNPKPLYRVIDEDLQILIDGSTYIEEVIKDIPDIPRHRFKFKTFDDIEKRAGDLRVLVDVIGVISGISQVQDRISRGHHISLQSVTIQDHRRKTLRVTLWGNLANVIQPSSVLQSEEAQIVVLTSMIVKKEDMQVSIGSSSATRIYVNLDDYEVFNFRKMCQENEAMERAVEINMPSVVLTRQNYEANKKTVAELNEMIENGDEMDKTYYVFVDILEIDTYNGWRYSCCTKCRRKLRVFESKLMCDGCIRTEEFPGTRYRVEVLVGDHTGQSRFVLFDKDVEKYVQIQAVQLAGIVAEENIDDPIPGPLTKLIGTKIICQVKFNEQSRGTLRETFTVNRTYEVSEIVEEQNQLDKDQQVLTEKRQIGSASTGEAEAVNLTPALQQEKRRKSNAERSKETEEKNSKKKKLVPPN